MVNYLNTKSEYVDKLKDEVEKAYSDYVVAPPPEAVLPLAELASAGNRVVMMCWWSGRHRGWAGGLLFASGGSLPMRTLAATKAGRVTMYRPMLSNVENVSTVHFSLCSVASMSVSVNHACSRANACAKLVISHISPSVELKKKC